MTRANLFRCPVAIRAELESVPPPPEGPGLFGLSEAQTIIEIGATLCGGTAATLRDRVLSKINVSALSDGSGVVLSISVNLYDKDGKHFDALCCSIAEPDARLIASSVSALFALTPEPSK